MDPQYPGSSGSNYDFIMNSGQQQKKPLVPKLGGESSFAKKLILILGGAFILIIIMWVVGNMLGGGGTNVSELTKIVQQGEEVSRVSAQGVGSARVDIRNAAANTTVSISSQKQQWLAFLAKRGTEIKEKDQKLLLNETTDQTLANAHSNNTFDSAFLDVMETYLADYAASLQAEYNRSSSETERTLLRAHFDQVQLLIKQYPER